jgi:high-affinity nickel-transport protein
VATLVACPSRSPVGYAIVGLFVITRAIALAVRHFGHIEEKWTARLQRTESA